MITSDSARLMIKQFEGLRLERYNDIGGVQTIGYGHTGNNLPNQITQEQADDYFNKDIKTCEDRVNKYNDIYHFTQNQFDALVSFCFNIGNIDQLTKEGTRNLSQVANKMLLYCRVAGKRCEGIYNRRVKERDLFNL